jgi:DNA (cytosine-5)-methyltransferase 1/tRNA (cytosine38-C5)-methyltransferase
MMLRGVEFFCGIGGLAAAAEQDGSVRIVQAIDIDQRALSVYSANFSAPDRCCSIESLSSGEIEQWQADLWWMSPPCQPYTTQGARRDMDDPRAASLNHLLSTFRNLRPRYVVIENVPGFRDSRMRQQWLACFKTAGYHVCEWELCPTSFGVPMRRVRYYLAASREHALSPLATPAAPITPLVSYLQDDWADRCSESDGMLARYVNSLHAVTPQDPTAVARCFTSAYGKSPVRSGSYLRQPSGRAVHFHPLEIARLMGFSREFSLPHDLSLRQAWSLLGNSLAVPVVCHILKTFASQE